MAMGGLNIGDLLLMILADGSQLRKDIERQGLAAADAAGPAIGRSLGAQMAAGLATSGKAMSSIGQSMSRNLTVPIVAAGTAITAVGVKFDTSLRQIVALTDVTADEIGMVEEAILRLAPAVGKSPQELAESFYYLASGGFNAVESLQILESSAKAAASGLGETQDVAKVIGASINAFGKDELSAVDATDQLIRAIKDGTAEAPAFAGALGDVVGSAGLLGATFADTAGAIAAMTLVGISPDEAATSLNQVFRALIKTTPQAAKGFAEVGLTVEGLRNQLQDEGLLPVLQTLEEAFAGNDVAAGKAFGEVRALRGVLALIGGDNLEQTAYILNDVAGGTTNLASAFAETEGPGRRMDQALARMQVTLIKLSDDVLPVVVEIMEAGAEIVGTLADAFHALPEPVRGALVRILAVTAALGPLLFISGKVVQGIGSVVGVFAKLANSRVGTQIVGWIVEAFGSLAGKIAKPVTDGITSGINAVKSSSAVTSGLDALGKFMGSTLGKVFSIAFLAYAVIGLAETWMRIKEETQAQLNSISTGVQKQIADHNIAALQTSKAALEKGIQDFKNNIPLNLLTPGLARANIQILEAELAKVNQALKDAGYGYPRSMADGMDDAQGALIKSTDNMIEAVSDTVEAADLGPAARAAGKMIPESIAEGILAKQHAPEDAMDHLKSVMKNAIGRVPRIARNIGYLTSTTLAKAFKDKRSVVVNEAHRTRDEIEQDLAKMILNGGKVGRKAQEALAKAHRSKNPDIRAAARRTQKIVDDALRPMVPAAADTGKDAGNALITNIERVVNGRVISLHPDIQVSLGRIGGGRASGGPVRAGVPYRINEETARSEWFVPSVSGQVVTYADAVDAIGGGASGGDTITYNVPIMGVLKADSPGEVVHRLRQVAAGGVAQNPRRRRRVEVPTK